MEDWATKGLKYAVATWHNGLLLWPHLCPVDQPGTSATRTLSKIELFEQVGERGYNQEVISKSHAWRVTRSHQTLFAMTQSRWIWSAASWDSLNVHESDVPATSQDLNLHLLVLRKPLGHNYQGNTVARIWKSTWFSWLQDKSTPLASRLYHSWVEEKLVVERTGHRSLEGVLSYQTSSKGRC